MTEKNKFFGERVAIQESFKDDENVEYAYYIGTNIAVFRQTDLDSGRNITLIKFDADDFAAAAKEKYNQFFDFVAGVSAITISLSRGNVFGPKFATSVLAN